MSKISSLLCPVGLLSLLATLPACGQYSKPVCSNGKNTTTISGVVYSPNGQDPLPDVLVYVPGPAGAVAITDGITTADLRPVNPLTQTTTAFDGSFTLSDAPAGTSIPVVIQSGKWQRQLVLASATACQDNVPPNPTGDKFARFPKNKSEGNIPRIGIVTGSVEATECVLRKVGIQDLEFTNYSSNGRINLYVGSRSGGSSIDNTTPGELTLMNDQTQLNSLDMLLFPCQGGDQTTSAAGMSNLAFFANNGGRVFVNHHSHAWLKANSGFANTFNWAADNASAPAGAATIDQTFTIGVTLSSWLQNLAQTTTQGQVSVTNVFASLGSITTNAQQWISLNSNSLPIQASFDTPIGAGAGFTYGRVLYNEYHVSPASSKNTIFPNECSGTAMSQQEKILEFSLFDLSSFAAITKIDPDMTLTGAPNPAKYNASITMTATLGIPAGSTYSLPTGGVTFSEGATTFGTAVLHAGVANMALPNLSAGSHIITAVYSGDPYYNARTVTTTVVVYPPATVSVSASPNPTAQGHASVITFTATSSASTPIPTGTVAITVDGVTTTYPLSGGAATTPGNVYTNGKHVITAVYSGDSNYATQTATGVLYVQVASTASLAVAAPSVFLLNPATFTATANGANDAVPGGTMTFYEGPTLLSAVTMSNGAAAFSTTGLSFGQHTVTASYSGDDYYLPSVTTSVVENVMDYQLTVANDSDVIPHSTTATYTFTLAPLGGGAMPADIKLDLSGLRKFSEVTMSPAVVAAGSGTTAVTVTIKTSDEPTLPPDLISISSLRLGAGGLALALAVFPYTLRRRRIARGLLLILACAALSTAIAGCGTGWKTLSYRLTLNTNSGALVHSDDLTLTEQGGN
ncbi:MAG TPA: Ig-like domain-containing protein [Acidobacteriaceae bacterium]|jgi:hypothetical protein